MAIISTQAIVVSSIKYGESSLISKLYTKDLGLTSYVMKGILKSKKGTLKAAYFQPLTLLSVVVNHHEKRNLHSIREAQVSYVYKTIHTDVAKQSIVMFLSEVLSSSIQEQESNKSLYEYLENAFLWLDNHNSVSNFHLLFLLNFTKFLGFYPDQNTQCKEGFHLREGIFTNEFTTGKEIVTGDQITQLKKLLGINFDALASINFSKEQRREVLRMLIRYFELHLGGFKTPRSLGVLEAVFSR